MLSINNISYYPLICRYYNYMFFFIKNHIVTINTNNYRCWKYSIWI